MVARLFFLVLILMVMPGKTCFGQQYNALAISEIMADPSPAIGLPEAEYIEIYNRSAAPIRLSKWTLSVGSRSVYFPDSVIMPGAFVIVCSQASYNSLKIYGPIITLSSFLLPNERGTVSLFDRNKKLIFSTAYDLRWWDPDKRNGGYALEMADLQNPCGEMGNWKTSMDVRGGTPGKQNSVREIYTDNTPPEIDRIDVISSRELRIVFNKKLDSLNAVSGAQIAVEGESILNKKVELPDFKNLVLTLNAPLVSRVVYAVSIRSLADCSGNILREAGFAIGLPQKADSGNVVLSEILFNPPVDGVDFVELYNTSNKFISLKNWSIGNTKNGLPDIFRTITNESLILAPFSYLALTTDPWNVKKNYPTDKIRYLYAVEAMPSFPNTSGGVIIQAETGQNMDQFDYAESLHAPLINNPEGVSLEKSDMLISSQRADNWHSAASTAGNATPGYANSQTKPEAEEDAFTVVPEAFIPGHNGTDDFAKITYRFQAAGEMATIRIYNTAGRLIKNLLRNQLMGTSGEVRWDGTNENGTVADTGYYLILIDTFNANGQTKQFKLKVVVVKN